MTFRLHTQPIDTELINIINFHSLHSKNHSTFVKDLVSSKQPKPLQTPIPMNTGNSHPSLFPKALSIFLLFAFCIAWAPANAQQPIQNDPLAPLYKAKNVKSITAFETGATADEKTKVFYKEFNNLGKLTFELVYDENGQITKKYQSFYNAENRLTKEVWTQDVTDSVIYKYKAGLVTEESWYWGADKSRTRVVHFYDSLSHKVCTVSKNNWGVYVDSFFYEDGQVSLVKNYNENGLLTSWTENTYDSKGRLTQEILKDENGNILQTNKMVFTEVGPKSAETLLFAPSLSEEQPIITASMAESYKYDSQKQLKEITNNSYTNNELLINNKVIFMYGDKGLPISQTTQNLANNTKQLLRFTYTFF